MASSAQSFQPFLHFCSECVLRLPLYSCDLAQRKEIEPLLKLRFASGIVSKFGEVFVLNIWIQQHTSLQHPSVWHAVLSFGDTSCYCFETHPLVDRKAHSRRTCMGPEKIGSDCLIALVCSVWGRLYFWVYHITYRMYMDVLWSALCTAFWVTWNAVISSFRMCFQPWIARIG